MKTTVFARGRAAGASRQLATGFSRISAGICIALGAAGAAAADTAAGPRSPVDLARLSIEELAEIEITSVSKRPEPLSEAAAAIYVITREDIRRSGATSIPEALRLAPNVQVARLDSNRYAITARGFNSTSANKLLVLIDGRSVYTQLFSGVFWEAQDVFLEDIERIEVVSGPGGTLWGSNAVNGVINIITRHSRDTTGALVSVGGGTDERGAGARYGARLGENATYRIYAKGFDRDETFRESGASTQDSWNKVQAGFRMDWDGAADSFTLQGDAYDGSIDRPVNDDKTISGGNLVARWNSTLDDGSAIEVQAYYDRRRHVQPGAFAEDRDTYDIEAQHRFRWGNDHDIVWGGGYRVSRDDVTNSAALAFLPERTSLKLANVFLQDSIALDERLQLTLGTKLEDNSYTGLEVQPNARLAWKLQDHALLWSAISRAVRTPSRLDRDFFAALGPPYNGDLAGGPDFQSEKLTAYEIGYRGQPAPHASFSISTFYNVYDELRSVEPLAGSPGTFVLGNRMEGETYGVELWGSYGLRDWWRLSAGYNYLKKHLRFTPDSGDTVLRNAGNDPTYQFSLRSAMNLLQNLELDVALRKIDDLPDPSVPGYVALDARLGWTFSKGGEISLTGSNLLDRRHPEFGGAATRSELDRTFYLKILWKL
jgi:iron complex outermembrane recepter protein